MNFDAKSEILKEIAKTDDQNIKAVLLLLLGVLEFTGDKIDGVSKQLETLLRDEQAMRVAVLNGHEPVHHKHHEWIEDRMKLDPEINAIMVWAKDQMDEQQSNRRWRLDVAKSVVAAAIIAAGSFLLGRALGA